MRRTLLLTLTLLTALFSSAQLPVSQVAATSTGGTLQSAAVANGNGSTLNTIGMASAVLTVNCSSCSGGTTVNFEGTEDGTNYTFIWGVQAGSFTNATSTTAAGVTVWEFTGIANYQNIRARISGYSAGTITITGHTSPVASTDPGPALSTGSGAVDPSTLRMVLAGSDPCSSAAKTVLPINITANTQLVAGVAAKKVYICGLNLVVGAATNVALVESATSGNACATAPTGMAGGATAATGWNFAANGGLSHGVGLATVFQTATAGDAVCLLVSAANQVSGTITYVQQQ